MKGKILFSIAISALVALAFTTSVVAQQVPEANSPPGVTGSLTIHWYDQTVYGNVFVAEKGGHTTAALINWTLNVNVLSGVTVRDAYLYLSFDNLENGDRSVEFNGNTLGDPSQHPYLIGTAGPFCTARFDVKNYVIAPGINTVIVTQTSVHTSSVYGAALVVIYEWPSGYVGAPNVRIIINDGCMWVAGNGGPQWGTTDFLVAYTDDIMWAHFTTMVQAGENYLADSVVFNTHNFTGISPWGDYFYGNCGYLWDVHKEDIKTSWPPWLPLSPPTRVWFRSYASGAIPADGYIVDFAILDIAYRWWPVGGTAFPSNKLALLAPYIILAALIAIVSVSVAVYWRKR